MFIYYVKTVNNKVILRISVFKINYLILLNMYRGLFLIVNNFFYNYRKVKM